VKCSEFLQELTGYLDGVLDERTKAELEDHLAWCHNCYVVCDTTKKTIEIYRDQQLYELPGDHEQVSAEEETWSPKRVAGTATDPRLSAVAHMYFLPAFLPSPWQSSSSYL
jgi:predicted anti-sigma-YlaC factor YlaD